MDIHLAVLPTQHHVLSDKDQNDWLDFITFCFHAKGTPRSHFARQLNNEPIHTILVARLASPTNTVSIVSTVRIFHRTIVPNIRTAGIGAVCTHPSYRKQGLSSKLLDFARQVIADMNAFDCSLLHCAPRFQSFYHQRGWTNTLLVETLVVDMVPTIHDNDTGDYIVVINAEKVEVTGKKFTDKIYYRHTGYIGNLKSITFDKLQAQRPERIIELAVKGMLPKGPLGRDMYRKLKVYAGPEHNHHAQKPVTLEV